MAVAAVARKAAARDHRATSRANDPRRAAGLKILRAVHRTSRRFSFAVRRELGLLGVDTDRHVIGALHAGPDERGGDPFRRARRREHVVDLPAYVALTRASTLSPPRLVDAFTWVARAKGVDPTRVDPEREGGALFGQEAARLAVLLRPREVDLLVRRVEVADHEHRASAPQRLNALQDGHVESQLVRDAAVVAFAAAALREVAVDDEGLAESRGDQPALDVESALADTDEHFVGLRPRVDGNAAVPRPAGREARMPSRRCARLGIELLRQRADLLHADDVRRRLAEELGECVARASA